MPSARVKFYAVLAFGVSKTFIENTLLCHPRSAQIICGECPNQRGGLEWRLQPTTGCFRSTWERCRRWVDCREFSPFLRHWCSGLWLPQSVQIAATSWPSTWTGAKVDWRAPSPSVWGEDSNTLKVVLEKVHEVLGLGFFDFCKIDNFLSDCKSSTFSL